MNLLSLFDQWKCRYHTFNLSFLLHGQDFRKPNFTPKKTTKDTKNTKNFSEKVKCRPFFTQSGKNYTWQKFFTQAPPVMPVTNMRYEYKLLYITIHFLVLYSIHNYITIHYFVLTRLHCMLPYIMRHCIVKLRHIFRCYTQSHYELHVITKQYHTL